MECRFPDYFFLPPLHNRDPVCFLTRPGLVAKQRLFFGEGKNRADPYLGFVPLEDEELTWPQNAEAFGAPLSKIVAPVTGPGSVLQPQPASTPARTTSGAMDRTPAC